MFEIYHGNRTAYDVIDSRDSEEEVGAILGKQKVKVAGHDALVPIQPLLYLSDSTLKKKKKILLSKWCDVIHYMFLVSFGVPQQ